MHRVIISGMDYQRIICNGRVWKVNMAASSGDASAAQSAFYLILQRLHYSILSRTIQLLI